MNVLIISLLRLGDILMHIEIANQWRIKNKSEITFVINDECKAVIPILEHFQYGYFLFPRRQIQSLINNSATHILEPIWQIQDLIREINLQSWDLILNLTHTQVSGRLMSLVSAREKKGMVWIRNHFELFGNSILQQFNDEYTETKESPRHYIEWLSCAFDLDIKKPEKNILPRRNKIFFQLFTSDEKKNWPLDSWERLFQSAQKLWPEFEFKVLCSDFEKQNLLRFWPSEDLLNLDIHQAFLEFSKGGLLVGCDTSLIHLASLARMPSLMISLGSSNPTKTSAFLEGSMTLSGQATCRPCSHLSACSQETQICAESVKVSHVLEKIKQIIHQHTYEIGAASL